MHWTTNNEHWATYHGHGVKYLVIQQHVVNIEQYAEHCNEQMMSIEQHTYNVHYNEH